MIWLCHERFPIRLTLVALLVGYFIVPVVGGV